MFKEVHSEFDGVLEIIERFSEVYGGLRGSQGNLKGLRKFT